MLKINLHEATGFTQSQNQKIKDAIKLIALVVNSTEFKDRILRYGYTPVYSTGSLWWKKTKYGKFTKGFYFAYGERVMTNDEIYKRIQSGWEEGEPVEDGEMDLYLRCESGRSSATAYGYPDNDRIVIYSSWVNSASVPELMNTIFHEWLHNQTFDHTFEYTYCRDFSVPYGVGMVAQEVAELGLRSGDFKI